MAFVPAPRRAHCATPRAILSPRALIAALVILAVLSFLLVGYVAVRIVDAHPLASSALTFLALWVIYSKVPGVVQSHDRNETEREMLRDSPHANGRIVIDRRNEDHTLTRSATDCRLSISVETSREVLPEV